MQDNPAYAYVAVGVPQAGVKSVQALTLIVASMTTRAYDYGYKIAEDLERDRVIVFKDGEKIAEFAVRKYLVLDYSDYLSFTHLKSFVTLILAPGYWLRADRGSFSTRFFTTPNGKKRFIHFHVWYKFHLDTRLVYGITAIDDRGKEMFRADDMHLEEIKQKGRYIHVLARKVKSDFSLGRRVKIAEIDLETMTMR